MSAWQAMFTLLEAMFTLLEAKNGQEAIAIAIAEELLPGLILMDMKMPIIDGYTVFKKIKEIEAL